MSIEAILTVVAEEGGPNDAGTVQRKAYSRLLGLQIEEVEDEAIGWLLMADRYPSLQHVLLDYLDILHELYGVFPRYHHRAKERQLQAYRDVLDAAQILYWVGALGEW